MHGPMKYKDQPDLTDLFSDEKTFRLGRQHGLGIWYPVASNERTYFMYAFGERSPLTSDNGYHTPFENNTLNELR